MRKSSLESSNYLHSKAMESREGNSPNKKRKSEEIKTQANPNNNNFFKLEQKSKNTTTNRLITKNLEEESEEESDELNAKEYQNLSNLNFEKKKSGENKENKENKENFKNNSSLNKKRIEKKNSFSIANSKNNTPKEKTPIDPIIPSSSTHNNLVVFVELMIQLNPIEVLTLNKFLQINSKLHVLNPKIKIVTDGYNYFLYLPDEINALTIYSIDQLLKDNFTWDLSKYCK